MKNISNTTINSLLLLSILLFCGLRWADKAHMLYETSKQTHLFSAASDIGVLTSASGIDATGHKIISVPFNATKIVVLFVLRGDSIREDMEFWDNVSSRISRDSGVALVGYCDGDICADTIHSRIKEPTYPVIRYAEVTPGRAIIAADHEGYFIIRKKSDGFNKLVKWRTPNRSYNNVMVEVGQ